MYKRQLQGNARTNWIWIPILGIVYFFLYYIVFSAIIRWRDLKTPGREDSGESRLYTRADYNEAKNENTGKENGKNSKNGENVDTISPAIVEGLGGKANISDVDCCATRLRCSVKDGKMCIRDRFRPL